MSASLVGSEMCIRDSHSIEMGQGARATNVQDDYGEAAVCRQRADSAPRVSPLWASWSAAATVRKAGSGHRVAGRAEVALRARALGSPGRF
eukprot:14191956-Alexandrium_andersonii.AAC.1